MIRLLVMKAYTDLEQSKKLAEFLPLESADMRIGNYVGKSGKVDGTNIHYYTKGESFGAPEIINAWSLATLLEAMPEYIKEYDGRVYKNYHLNLYRSYYHCCSYSFGFSAEDDATNILYCIGKENWVDACYEMIIKLHEQNLL